MEPCPLRLATIASATSYVFLSPSTLLMQVCSLSPTLLSHAMDFKCTIVIFAFHYVFTEWAETTVTNLHRIAFSSMMGIRCIGE